MSKYIIKTHDSTWVVLSYDHPYSAILLMREKIPCQQRKDRSITSTKLASQSFAVAMGLWLQYYLQSWFSSTKEGLDASAKEDLGFF